jgi:hypothetical protein
MCACIDYTAGHYPMVIPIDAEAHYYDSRLPVADPACIAAGPPGNPIPNLLGRHRGSCIARGLRPDRRGADGPRPGRLHRIRGRAQRTLSAGGAPPLPTVGRPAADGV